MALVVFMGYICKDDVSAIVLFLLHLLAAFDTFDHRILGTGFGDGIRKY